MPALYLASNDPYGFLARYLKNDFQQANIVLAPTPETAAIKLIILDDQVVQDLLGISSTQQTRQYNLSVIVKFQLTDHLGNILLGPEVLTETRAITVQSSQILAGSNETNTITQQMHRTIAHAIISRLASQQAARAIAAVKAKQVTHS